MCAISMAEYLVFAPHPDDAELGMGATIATLIQAGREVVVVDLSDGEPTPYGSVETRRRETADASKALALRHRRQMTFVNRQITHDLASRHALAAVIREIRPRVLFAPYSPDAHPDHVAATRLIEDARFDAKLTQSDIPGEPHHAEKIIYYYCTHLRIHIDPSFALDVSEWYGRKTAALEAYQSQFYVGRGEQAGTVPDMVRLRDRYFGGRIGVQFAEPLFTQEVVGLSDLNALR
jgi:N-acetylglucosamine malate deacetylase 1